MSSPQVAQSANLAPLKEDRALLTGNDGLPRDVLISHLTAGKDTAIAITVINALRQDLVEMATNEPCHAVNTAYNTK